MSVEVQSFNLIKHTNDLPQKRTMSLQRTIERDAKRVQRIESEQEESRPYYQPILQSTPQPQHSRPTLSFVSVT